MKRIIYSLTWMLFIGTLVLGCKEEEIELGASPTPADASFTFTPTTGNANIIDFSSPSSAFMKKWDFGNGETAEGNSVRMAFPFEGNYVVKLTVFTSGGSTTTSQTVNILKTDLSLLKPVYSLLTGGSDPGEKTWVIDFERPGHFGVGPSDAASPIWYAAAANEKSETGFYDDKFIFRLSGLQFVQQTNGDVYVNGAQQSKFPGAFQNKGDFTAPFTPPAGLKWSVTENTQGKQFLNIIGNGFIGYYAGTSTYEILEIDENKMFLKHVDAANPALGWFLRLKREGYVEPLPPVLTTALPQDFEGAAPPFNGFGGSTFAVVNNPSATGINTSAKVGRYVKGTDGSWAGIETTLSGKVDFSTNTQFKYKVYSPVTGKALLKLEVAGNPSSFVEVFANVTKVNQWEELTFSFAGAASNTFDKMAMFLDFDNNAGGTFYIDDIRQVAPGCDDADQESLNPASLVLTMGTTTFGQFGDIASAKVDNPFKTGINTSCFVNSYQKTAGCQTWSGVGLLLPNAIDFATVTKKKFKMKVYAVNQTTQVTLRLERLPFPDQDPAEERVATITQTGQWQELEFDFSNVAGPLTFKNVIVYFEKGANCDNDLYYFDDIVQF